MALVCELLDEVLGQKIDVAAALAQPDVKAWIDGQGGVAGGDTPQALRTFQAAEAQKWRDLIRAANIKAD